MILRTRGMVTTALVAAAVACSSDSDSGSGVDGNGGGAGLNGGAASGSGADGMGGGAATTGSGTGGNGSGADGAGADGSGAGCVPRTCEELGINCGPAGDGCGAVIECGSCTAPDICGGGGPSLCGVSSADGGGCVPQTCEQAGANCGPVADGCGALIDSCGTCTAPAICGGGGEPSVCGGGTTGGGGTSGGGGTTGGGGASGSGVGGSAGTYVSFPGSGTGSSSVPLQPGQGPETADDCVAPTGGSSTATVTSSGTQCFYGTVDPTSPAATVEYVVENINGVEMVHIRVTFDPSFTDTSYGAGSIGWPPVRGHRFSDLTGSDHTELKLLDADGNVAMHFKVDLASADATSPCGYGSLGVSGGDGAMFIGDPNDILAVTTSLDRNLNACGYCNTVDSPATDESYTPNPATPNWDYRQVYELWIDASAFGSAGFGEALIEFVHSSPAKTADTITTTPGPCPPNWDEPYCPPNLVTAGALCGTGGSGGAGGTGGAGGAAGTGGMCFEGPCLGTGGTAGSGGTGGSGGTAGSGGMAGAGGMCFEGPCTGTGGTAGSGGSGGTTSTPLCPPGYTPDLATEGALCCPIVPGTSCIPRP